MQGVLGLSGKLARRMIRGPRAPLAWRLKNMLRWDFLSGWLAVRAAKGFSKLTGIPTLTSQLSAVLIKANGATINYGVLGYKLVTTAFVNFLVDQLQTETSEWGDFKFHDSGIGVTGANVSDTDIETTDQESRATGTQTESAANAYRSVGTISYTNSLAITEHGLFSTIAGTTLMDRHTFAALNVVNGDSVQFTYTFTVSSGG